MSSVGVIEVLIALRMQFIRKINAPLFYIRCSPPVGNYSV